MDLSPASRAEFDKLLTRYPNIDIVFGGEHAFGDRQIKIAVLVDIAEGAPI